MNSYCERLPAFGRGTLAESCCQILQVNNSAVSRYPIPKAKCKKYNILTYTRSATL
ncbi:MAG: hypothetical protein MRJ93_05930 [Nitrososphaeraceae archaeon]|nr:hypothetical protein [Nitrososphaeraceae archaeon]